MSKDWGSQKGQTAVALQADDVRDFLIENPTFLDENDEILGYMVPPAYKRGDRVEDFQRFMLARLQNHFLAIRGENDDLMDLMQDQIQRQNRVNTLVLDILDTPDFPTLLTRTLTDMAESLDHVAVSLFMETHPDFQDLEEGSYGHLKLVKKGFIDTYLKNHDLLMWEKSELQAKTSMTAARDLFGETETSVQSLALLRWHPTPESPQCLLALGHEDPLYYATGLATETLEFLAAILERSFARFLG